MTRPPPAEPIARLRELDALRGIAAVGVMLYHFTAGADAADVSLRLYAGRYGVVLFFAVSGFVILLTLNRVRHASDFIVSRFSRLYPAYWAAVLLTTLIVSVANVPQLRQPADIVIVNLTMAQDFLGLPLVDPSYWTLSLELGFYLCMLALWQLRLLKRIEWVLALWIGLKWLWHWLPLPVPLGLLLVQGQIPFFAIGVIAYRCWSGERGIMQQLPLLAWVIATVALLNPPPVLWAALVTLALFALLATRRLAWLSVRPLLWLGALSYPLYLVHQNLGRVVILYLEGLGISPIYCLIAAIAASFLAATAIMLLVERPAMAAIRRWWGLRRAALPPAGLGA